MSTESRGQYSTLVIRGNDSVVVNISEPAVRDLDTPRITTPSISSQLQEMKSLVASLQEDMTTLQDDVFKLSCQVEKHIHQKDEEEHYSELDPGFNSENQNDLLPDEEEVYKETLQAHFTAKTVLGGENGEYNSYTSSEKVGGHFGMCVENSEEYGDVAYVGGHYFSYEEFCDFVDKAITMRVDWIRRLLPKQLL